jgi:hypothetical protein
MDVRTDYRQIQEGPQIVLKIILNGDPNLLAFLNLLDINLVVTEPDLAIFDLAAEGQSMIKTV